MLHKSSAGLNKKPVKLITVILFACMLSLIALSVPAAKAGGTPTLNLNPTSDPVGATVLITGSGFSPGQFVSVFSGNYAFADVLTSDANGNINGSTTVPSSFTPGTYQITAEDALGIKATAEFVVEGSSSSSSSTSTSSSSTSSSSTGSSSSGSTSSGSTSSGNGFPTLPPTTTSSSSGFFSPLVIAIIVVVLLAVAIPSVLFLRGNGDKRRMMYERERERDRERDRMSYGSQPGQGPYGGGSGGGYSQPPRGYGPQPSNYGPPPSSTSGSRYTPYSYRQPSQSSYQSRYSQPASSYRPSSYASRYSQPQGQMQQPQQQSSYSRPAARTKTCSHCHRSVREDQNICPYCNKRV